VVTAPALAKRLSGAPAHIPELPPIMLKAGDVKTVTVFTAELTQPEELMAERLYVDVTMGEIASVAPPAVPFQAYPEKLLPIACRVTELPEHSVLLPAILMVAGDGLTTRLNVCVSADVPVTALNV
jgi:hypothetical protein